MLGWLPQLLDRRVNRAALRMPEDDDEPRAERLGRELDAANLRRRDNVAGHPDHEQIPEALVEHDLGRYPGIGAAEDDGKGCLVERELYASPAAHAGLRSPDVRYKALIPLAKTVECLVC